MQDKYKSDFVNVVARIKPTLEDQRENDCLQKISDPPAIIIPQRQQTYFLDYVFDQEANQETVYDNTVKHLVDKLLLGYNSTVFAYGQTGSGKTYTMGTDASDLHIGESAIIFRTIKDITKRAIDLAFVDNQVTIHISFYEIYNEKVYDLLRVADKDVPLKVQGFQICDLIKTPIKYCNEGLVHLERGGLNRHKGETKQNLTSSRSHAVFTFYINLKNEDDEFNAKLNLVDLAGSECVKRTCTEGSQFQEGVNINRGLLSIGQVISALSKSSNKNHIPYRESVITSVLKDSLNRNNYITLIACVSASAMDMSDTIQTLEFAQRAKKLKNKPEINLILEQNRPPNTPSLTKSRSISRYRTPLTRPPPFTTSTFNNNNTNNQRQITSFPSTPSLRPIRSKSVNVMPKVIKTTASSANVNDVVQMRSPNMSDLNGDCSVHSVASSRLDATVLSPFIKSYLETKHNDAMAKLQVAFQEKLEETLANIKLGVVGSKINNESSPGSSQYSERPIRTARANLQTQFDTVENSTKTKSDNDIFKIPKPLPRKRKLLTVADVTENEVNMISPSKRRRSVRLQEKDLKNMSIINIKSEDSFRLQVRKSEVTNPRRRSGISIKIAKNSLLKKTSNNRKLKIPPIPAPRSKATSILKNNYNRVLDILNFGDENKLMELSSIGVKTAKQIYYYRSIRGKFNTISDLATMPWKGKGYQRFLDSNFLVI